MGRFTTVVLASLHAMEQSGVAPWPRLRVLPCPPCFHSEDNPMVIDSTSLCWL